MFHWLAILCKAVWAWFKKPVVTIQLPTRKKERATDPDSNASFKLNQTKHAGYKRIKVRNFFAYQRV